MRCGIDEIATPQTQMEVEQVSRMSRGNDPFLNIVIENWGKLSFEDRGRLAGMVRDMGSHDVSETQPLKLSLVCPKCHGAISEEHASGEKFNCPHCGQHIIIN